MKMVKITVGISNIVLSVIYAAFSWIVSFFGLMLYTYTPKENFSVSQIIGLASSVILICTILFCVIGIIASVVLLKKGKYKLSFAIQFLPFATVFFALFLILVSIFCSGI